MTDPTRITLQRDHNNGRFVDVGRLDPVLDRILYLIDLTAEYAEDSSDMVDLVHRVNEELTPSVIRSLQSMVDMFEGDAEDCDEIRWKGEPGEQYYDSPTGDYTIEPGLVRWFLRTVKRVQREQELLGAPEAN